MSNKLDPARSIRVPDALWEEFGKEVADEMMTISAKIRVMMLLYVEQRRKERAKKDKVTA